MYVVQDGCCLSSVVMQLTVVLHRWFDCIAVATAIVIFLVWFIGFLRLCFIWPNWFIGFWVLVHLVTCVYMYMYLYC